MSTGSKDYGALFRLDGKVALITGGAQGIGAECGRALASAGASIVITDVREWEGEALAQSLRADGHQAAFLQQDVVDEARWHEIIGLTIESFGGLDILINNAGVESMSYLVDVELKEFQRIFDVNVNGTFLGCKHAVKAMQPGGAAGRGGSIINLSSIAGLTGNAALGAYNAAKGAVRLLTKSVAIECAKLQTGIRCNSIHPGLIKTGMGDHFLQNYVDLGMIETIEKVEQTFMDFIPLGRWGEPQDIAAVAIYLASEASRYVTGAELVVDGGMYAS